MDQTIQNHSEFETLQVQNHMLLFDTQQLSNCFDLALILEDMCFLAFDPGHAGIQTLCNCTTFLLFRTVCPARRDWMSGRVHWNRRLFCALLVMILQCLSKGSPSSTDQGFLPAHNKRTLTRDKDMYWTGMRVNRQLFLFFRTGPEMKQVWKPTRPDVGPSKGWQRVAQVHICSTSSSAGFVLILSKLNWLGFLETYLRFARYTLFSSWCLATWWSTWGANPSCHMTSRKLEVSSWFEIHWNSLRSTTGSTW